MNGLEVLPLSGSNPMLDGLPIIDGTITLGNDTTISGFEIEHGANASAVAANGVSNIQVDSIVSVFSADPLNGSPGIDLQSVGGSVMITRNRLTSSAGIGFFPDSFRVSGVLIEDSPTVAGLIAGNEIANSVHDAIAFVNSGFTGDITGNDLRGSRNGLAFVDNAGAADTTFMGSIRDNRLVGNKIAGIALTSAEAQTGSLITANTFEQNQSSAVEIDDSDFAADIIANTIVGPFLGDPAAVESSRIFSVGGGVLSFTPPSRDDLDTGILAFNSNFTGDIRDNQISGTGIYGIYVELDSDSTLEGDITGNSVSEAVFAGIFVRGTGATGLPVTSNILNNTIDGSFGTADEADDTFSGISVSTPNSPFTGNVASNVTNDMAGTGLSLNVASFTGDITGNDSRRNGTSTINGSRGIEVVLNGGNFTGDIAGNMVSDNGRGIELENVGGFTGDITGNTVMNHNFDAIEVLFSDTGSFTGNVTDNVISNMEKGIFIRSLMGSFSGDITGNMIADGRGSGLNVLVGAGSFTGDIRDNVVTNTDSPELFRDQPMPRSGIGIGAMTFIGDVSGNTASNNNGSGIGIVTSRFSGDVTDNVTRDNGVSGIRITPNGTRVFSSGATRGLSYSDLDFTGDVTGNTASDNDCLITFNIDSACGGLFLEATTFTGDIRDNVTDSNLDNGIHFIVGMHTGAIDNNRAMNNRDDGFEMFVTGAGTSAVDFQNNQYNGNTILGSQVDVSISNTGSGILNLSFENNTAAAASGLNFDLRNTGGGTFNVTPTGAAAANTGSLGSGDGSVIIP